MTPGETVRTVIAMLEADLDGTFDGDLFEGLVGDVDVFEVTSMLGCAVQMFTSLAELHPASARAVLDGHRGVSFEID